MKRLLALLLLPLLLFAFEKSVEHPQLLAGKWCSLCGMDLAKYYKTNHAVILKNGEKKEYCSLHCFAEEYPNIKARIKKILVVDARSGKWIDAKRAWYVVGSDVKGTMSPVSKLAFKEKIKAEDFVKQHGGKVMRFDEVFVLAKKSLEKERKMLAKKKRFKLYPMGKMLYKRYCKGDIKRDSFKNIGQLKDYLVRECPKLKGKKLQAVALYIWEAKDKKVIKVPQDAKCPVCGMFVAKYPRWAAMMVDVKGDKLYFDGVKDMMKYFFSHKAKRLYVSDYYTNEAIEAQRAYYVVGSNVYGPMGRELIPFKTKEAAEAFGKDHGGKVISFNQITKNLVEGL